ncbi:hypothetical protein MHYP_G00188540 [Metynnis hypsauchen]
MCLLSGFFFFSRLCFEEESIMKGNTFIAVLGSWVERSRKRGAHRICRRAHPPRTTKPPFIFSSITLYPLHCACASECSPSRRPFTRHTRDDTCYGPESVQPASRL